MSPLSSTSQFSFRAEENAMLLPSGVQVGRESSKSPSVICFASAEPSAGTT